jgi:CPA2 family monovalent cation:H+ antiporter-2
MTFSTLNTIISVLLTVLVITVTFRRLRLPVVLGYFLVGALMGPHALGFIPNTAAIKKIAEFGIVFLMFTVGLDFSVSKLFALKYAVFVIGGLQVFFSILLTVIVGISLGMTIPAALVVGSIVAMSSTAIVIKQLHDQLELHSVHGLNAVGILLFQDLAVIPVIILIVGLSENATTSLSVILLWALLKGFFAISLIFFAGRWLLQPIFHLISKTREIELFTLTVLLITLTAAWLTNILGLSYALGAFLAGIILAETEFRHQIEVEIRPFRDILLGLFFITIGMVADASHWHETWPWILLLLSTLVLGKLCLITLISRLTKDNNAVALRTGLVLAHGGEFGFAILTLALTHQILPEDYGQVVLGALLLSMAISPFLIYFNKNIAKFLLPTTTNISENKAKREISKAAEKLEQHIILCGFGRVGQHIARILDQAEVLYIGLDLDAKLIKNANLSGNNVIYGDASHLGILQAAKLDQAQAIVISFERVKLAIKILSMVRQIHPTIPILVRCKDGRDLTELKKYGATRVIAETFEESLTLSYHLLQLIQIPGLVISELIQNVRNNDYALFQKVFSSSFHQGVDSEVSLHEDLKPILISAGAYAINRSLGEFDLTQFHIEIVAIRRKNGKPMKPRRSMKLHADDIIVVYGTEENVQKVKTTFLEGP